METPITQIETGPLLPEAAWRKINEVLFNPDADVPGREELVEAYAKMLYHTAHRAEYRLLMAEKKAKMMKKTFDNWLPIVRKFRMWK